MDRYPSKVRIVEVGARDGLQNEAITVSVADRIKLINLLTEAGFSDIESGSFVSPKWIPQMASSAEVLAGIDRKAGVVYSTLVPNMQGLEAAIEAGASEVAVFAAASEAFSQRNINCSINESLARFEPVLEKALAHHLPVRAYVSCVIGCPYDGPIEPRQVAELARKLVDMGCYEVSLGDTIGIGTPASIRQLLDRTLKSLPAEQLALHCHDTYGQALANIYASLEMGIQVFDSSISGLGGCPYAKGATGNVATEDLLYMLHAMGIETGINLDLAIKAGQFISEKLGRSSQSRVNVALSQSASC